MKYLTDITEKCWFEIYRGIVVPSSIPLTGPSPLSVVSDRATRIVPEPPTLLASVDDLGHEWRGVGEGGVPVGVPALDRRRRVVWTFFV